MKTFLGFILFTIGVCQILAAVSDPLPGTVVTDALLLKYFAVGLCGIVLGRFGWKLMEKGLYK